MDWWLVKRNAGGHTFFITFLKERGFISLPHERVYFFLHWWWVGLWLFQPIVCMKSSIFLECQVRAYPLLEFDYLLFFLGMLAMTCCLSKPHYQIVRGTSHLHKWFNWDQQLSLELQHPSPALWKSFLNWVSKL